MERELLSNSVKNRIRICIEEASGNEVFFVGSFTVSTVIDEVRVVARGKNYAVPAVIDSASPGEVVIHNHPSGNLTPSEQDLQIASVFGNQGIGRKMHHRIRSCITHRSDNGVLVQQIAFHEPGTPSV